jgi:tRNA threonylcarbamoyladenosine biosynthesis protein TsaE
MHSFLSKSPEETSNYAFSFASSLRRNDIVMLIGDLGSGKTQFVKGVCRFFHVQDIISSPTFVMLHRYEGQDNRNEELLLYHFDLYKVKVESEILELGFEEFSQANGICLVEWADKLRELVPHRRNEIRFTLGSTENERRIDIERFPTNRTNSIVDLPYTKKLQSEHPRY